MRLQPVSQLCVYREKSICDQCWCYIRVLLLSTIGGSAVLSLDQCVRSIMKPWLDVNGQTHTHTHTHTLLILEHHVYLICAILMFCVLNFLQWFLFGFFFFCLFLFFFKEQVWAWNFPCIFLFFFFFQLQVVVCIVPNTAFGICFYSFKTFGF